MNVNLLLLALIHMGTQKGLSIVLDLIKLHRILDEYFSMDELNTLCFQVGVDIDDLGGVGQTGKARALIQHLEKRGRTADLLPIIANERPHLDLSSLHIINFAARLRPAIPGASISHTAHSAATFGCLVIDRKPPYDVYLLCDTSGLAPASFSPQAGDAILQPGRADGGNPATDVIAALTRWAPLKAAPADAANNISATLARISHLSDVSPIFHGRGFLQGVRAAKVGMAVAGNGRTSPNASGTIQQLNLSINLPWPASQVENSGSQEDAAGNVQVAFTDVIAGTPMIEAGDSGMVIMDSESYAIGMAFAGSERQSYFIPIQKVLDILEVDLVTEAVWQSLNKKQNQEP